MDRDIAKLLKIKARFLDLQRHYGYLDYNSLLDVCVSVKHKGTSYSRNVRVAVTPHIAGKYRPDLFAAAHPELVDPAKEMLTKWVCDTLLVLKE